MKAPESMTEVWLQRLSHPLVRGMSAVAFGLMIAILTVDVVVALANLLGLSDSFANLAAIVVTAFVAPASAVAAYRGLGTLAEDYDDSLND